MAAATVGFIGVDESSLVLAAKLISSGYAVKAYEELCPSVDEFLKIGGVRCATASEAAKGVASLVLLVTYPDQLTNILLSQDGALKGLKKDASIIICSTISPVYIQKLEKNLAESLGTAYIVDIYVYKAVSDVLNGKTMILSSGRSDAIAKAQPILSAMCDKLHIFEGELGAGSKVKLVTELLEGIHFVASVEAISLGAQAGIHPWILYDIISNAAGNSWVFKNHVPQLLRGNQTKNHFLNTLLQNLGIVLDMAKSLTFPLPLLAVAYQQLLAGASQGRGVDDDATLIKAWEKVLGVNITDAANAEKYKPEELANHIVSKSQTVSRVGFIGLGAMGFGMATHLLKSNFVVTGYDVYKPTLSRFENLGGLIGYSPAEVSKEADILVIMVTNEAQAESVLYGDLGAVSVLPTGASIILSSTVSPAFISQLERRLKNEHKNLKLIDAPVSGGVKRASEGTLTIMASGTDEALEHAGSILSALSEKLYVLRGGCGAGSGVKMVNQLLAGVHIASTAEAMAFGARPGLNSKLKWKKNKSETGCQEVGLMGVGSSQNGVGINHPGAVAAGYVSGGAAAIGAGNSGAVAGGSGVLLVVLLPVALVVLVLLGTVIPLVCKSIHGKNSSIKTMGTLTSPEEMRLLGF